MFAFCFGLQFVGISLCTGILTFSREPEAVVYRQEGSDAAFVWEFVKSDGLKSTSWEFYNKTQGSYVYLRIEDENGTNVEDPAIPPAAYFGRLDRNGSATLIIKNVQFEDTTRFKCTLTGKPGFVNKESTVELVVTGRCTVNPRILPAEVGGSVTFTCNAANVPSQNFIWTRGGKASEKIVNDSQHSVVSVAGSSQLTLKDISVGLGYYVCNCTVNIDPPGLSGGYLQVLRALKEDKTDCAKNISSVSMGSQLTICCPVSGYPPPVVTWEKDGIELQKEENTEFTIAAVEEEHFGHYTCTATDGITSLGPFNITVVNKVAKLSLNATDGTEGKPAKLTWDAPQPEPDYFTVEYAGSDILDDIVGVNVLVGKQQSLEFHYHTVVLKEANSKPDQTDICAEVTAFKDKTIVGVSTACKKITIKKPSDTEV